MGYNNGRGTLIYNGELYNYLELRDELALAGEKVRDAVRYRGPAGGAASLGP